MQSALGKKKKPAQNVHPYFAVKNEFRKNLMNMAICKKTKQIKKKLLFTLPIHCRWLSG
jgi:hypothetical protein